MKAQLVSLDGILRKKVGKGEKGHGNEKKFENFTH
jgi:hypothetical protein